MPTWLERLVQDVRHAARVFAKSPGFTAIAVLSIAFGTGANVAIFSAVDAMILRPLPVERPGELLTIGTMVDRGGGFLLNLASYPEYVDVRERSRSVAGFAAYANRRAGVRTDPAAPPQIQMISLVNADFFRVLGVNAIVGRTFRADEDAVPGRNPVAVLSYGMWRQQFNGEASALGRIIRIAGLDDTVIGVIPESFTGVDVRNAPDAVYVPFAMWARVLPPGAIDPLTARGLRGMSIKGRIRPGVTAAEARQDVAAIGDALEAEYPPSSIPRSRSATIRHP